MIGDDFYYAGEALSSYGLVMADSETDSRFAGRTINRSEMTPIRSIPNYYSVQYSDVLVLSFLVIKDPCVDESEETSVLTDSDIFETRSWLESPKEPAELRIYGDETIEVVYYGLFTDIQPYTSGGQCYGLNLTFTCNAPYGFTPVETTVIDSFDSEFILFNPSAEKREYLYPLIRVSMADTSGGAIALTNVTDNNSAMSFTVPSGIQYLYIDTKQKIVYDDDNTLIAIGDVFELTSESSNYSLLQSDAYTINWLGLVYGNNSISVSVTSGSLSEISFIMQYPIKAGGY